MKYLIWNRKSFYFRQRMSSCHFVDCIHNFFFTCKLLRQIFRCIAKVHSLSISFLLATISLMNKWKENVSNEQQITHFFLLLLQLLSKWTIETCRNKIQNKIYSITNHMHKHLCFVVEKHMCLLFRLTVSRPMIP